VSRVAAFVEKPNAATAAAYVAQDYLWNSGNFLFRADALLAELERFEPAMAEAVEKSVAAAVSDLGFVRLDEQAFARAPQKSIDYAVMEKTARAAVVEGRFRWSDIGSWDAILEVAPRDQGGNSASGPVVSVDAKDCIIHAEGRLTVVLGVEDLIVVTTPDAVLVLPRARAQDVKPLVAELNRRGRAEAREHRRVHRPWGYYESVDAGDRFQVKRIVVAPAGKLSLQKHHHRAEHWVVVRGTAQVTRGTDVYRIGANESTYIPVETQHRLENPATEPLVMIEVQCGDYLGEDDIVRFDDMYGRLIG